MANSWEYFSTSFSISTLLFHYFNTKINYHEFQFLNRSRRKYN